MDLGPTGRVCCSGFQRCASYCYSLQPFNLLFAVWFLFVMNEVPVTLAAGSSSIDPPTSGAQLSVEIVAAIQRAVDNSFAARGQMLPPSTWPTSSSIVSQANLLLSVGTSTVPSHFGAVGGKSPVVVPSFMNTFSTANALPALPAMLNASSNVTGSMSTSNVSAIPSVSSIMPTLYQPFVVGPGYSPIPAKLVSQIVTGKFIDLNDLLLANLVPVTESEPQPMLDRWLVLSSAPKKPSVALRILQAGLKCFPSSPW